MGKIEFFQHKNLLHSEKFEISQNEKKKLPYQMILMMVILEFL